MAMGWANRTGEWALGFRLWCVRQAGGSEDPRPRDHATNVDQPLVGGDKVIKPGEGPIRSLRHTLARSAGKGSAQTFYYASWGSAQLIERRK